MLGAVFFNTNCNEQLFSPKPAKNVSCRFRKKRKIAHFNSEK